MNVTQKWLSVSELGDWLGISRSKSYEILRSGANSLPAYRIGRALRIRKQDVEQWMEANQFKGTTDNGRN